jgi:hypothetical protein
VERLIKDRGGFRRHGGGGGTAVTKVNQDLREYGNYEPGRMVVYEEIRKEMERLGVIIGGCRPMVHSLFQHSIQARYLRSVFTYISPDSSWDHSRSPRFKLGSFKIPQIQAGIIQDPPDSSWGPFKIPQIQAGIIQDPPDSSRGHSRSPRFKLEPLKIP